MRWGALHVLVLFDLMGILSILQRFNRTMVRCLPAGKCLLLQPRQQRAAGVQVGLELQVSRRHSRSKKSTTFLQTKFLQFILDAIIFQRNAFAILPL